VLSLGTTEEFLCKIHKHCILNLQYTQSKILENYCNTDKLFAHSFFLAVPNESTTNFSMNLDLGVNSLIESILDRTFLSKETPIVRLFCISNQTNASDL